MSSSPPPRPGAARAVASGRPRVGAILMVVGGAIVLLSVFLPRLSVTGSGGTVTVGGISGAGIGFLFLAGLAVAKGLERLRPGTVPIGLSSPILSGLFMAVLLVFRWSDLQRALDLASQTPGITAAVGPGFWLSVVGTILVLCGGALIQFGDRLP